MLAFICDYRLNCYLGKASKLWKWQEKASLTLSRCILKSIKRSDTHISDRYRIDIAIDCFYIWLSIELIPREDFKVGEVSKMLCFSWERLSQRFWRCKKEKKQNWTLTHSVRSYQLYTTRLNVRIMKIMHDDKKSKIIWNFPKVT